MSSNSNEKITLLTIIGNKEMVLPFFDGSNVKAGFPSPAMDYMQDSIDLNQVLIKHPSSTFLVQVEGDSMIEAFISDPALLIVDMAIQPKDNDIVLAVVNGEFTVKRFKTNGSQVTLMPANKKYKPIEIVDGIEFSVRGVVTKVIIDTREVSNVRTGRL